jgi:hypothetical protein
MILPWVIANFRMIAATLLFGALILICQDVLIALFSYFILIALVHWANAAQVPAQTAPLHFAVICLKWYILFGFFNQAIDGPQFFWGGMETLIFMLVAWLWLVFDRRPATIVRLVTLVFISFLVLIFDTSLTVSPLSLSRSYALYYEDFIRDPEVWDAWFPPVIGLLIGFLLSTRLTNTLTRVSFLQMLGVTPRQLILMPKQSLFGIICGAAATICLIGLFTMQMTMPYQQAIFSGRESWIENLKDPTLFRIYDIFIDPSLALANAINGITSLSLFVLLGTLAYWLLNKRGIVGILPVLTLGGTLGFAWSHATPVVYETPYFDAHGAATLLGMITAMGFGAASHAVSSIRFLNRQQVDDGPDTQSPAI